MKQDYILRYATLARSKNLDRGVIRSGRISIKNVDTQEYLTISASQSAILERFKEPQRVPDLLPKLIYERACPSLKEFYELILQAVAAGILYDRNAIQEPVEPVRAFPWRGTLNALFARLLIVLCFAAGLAAVVVYPIELPVSWLDLLGAYVLCFFAGSIGSCFAAAHLHWAGGEIYRPYLRFNIFTPRLDFDVSDCLLYPKVIQERMALLRLCPHILLLACVLVLYPNFGYVALMSFFLLSIPANNAPVIEYIRTRFSQDALSTDSDPIFNPNRVLRHLIGKHTARLNLKYVLTRISYTFLWLVLVYIVNLRLFDANHPRLFQEAFAEHGSVPFVVLLLLVLSIVLSASTAVVLLVRNLLSLHPSKGKPTGRNLAALADLGIQDLDGISKFLRKCYFIEQLKLEDSAIRAIAESGRVVEFKKREDIVVESEEGQTFYIMLSGKVRVLRTNSAGREVKCADLASGDAFGEVALLKEGLRTRTVRALGKVIVLEIGLDAFNEIILRHAKAEELEAILQRQSFINRLPFTADWPPETIRDLGQKMRIASYPKDKKLLSCGDDNRFFYIVYEGSFKVEIDGKRIGKVKAGEFLGEISLLQNSVIQADVIAFEESQCLYMDKRDFIRFISEEFVVSLYFEKVSSKRLKHPIFPYRGKSFDIYRP